MNNARRSSLVSAVIAGVVAATWSVAGAAAPSSPSSATSPSSGGADRSIIVVGGRSGSRMPLNPQPLPPRWGK